MAQNVGQGEQRFNVPFYKASHNSYDRNESLAEQIDDYNIWQIELDIYDYLGELKVNHTCDAASINAADTLSFLLQKLVSESKTYTNKFTIIYLDLKECSIANWGDELNERLKATFIEALGQEHIYPSSDFIREDKDDKSWPSFQELVRRGRFWGIVVDWHGYDQTPDNARNDELFFTAISDPPENSEYFENTVLVCIDGGCNVNPTSLPKPKKDEKWMYRVYPGGDCALDCGQQNGLYWTNGLDSEYTFVASNCVNRAHTFARTHSPNPLYVDQSAIVACPVNGESCEWGTYSFPFHNLAEAIDRASPMVSLFIKAGEYQLRNNGAPFDISKPLILKAVNGIVRIK